MYETCRKFDISAKRSPWPGFAEHDRGADLRLAGRSNLQLLHFTSGFSLDAADYDMVGPTVGLCCGCGNDGDLYRAGLDKATKMWVPAADRAPALPSAM